MADPRLYQSDTFVLLESGQPEQFLTTAELLEKLKSALANSSDDLPSDVLQFASVEEQAKYLLETYCELTTAPGDFLQWYMVRLEK
jgi:Protein CHLORORESPIRATORY REDUCTION 7